MMTGPESTLEEHPTDAPDLEALIEADQMNEAVRTLDRLPEQSQADAVASMQPEAAATLVEHLVDIQAADLVERLDPSVAALILDEMASDVRADILADLQPPTASAIFGEMAPADADEARQLSRYGDRTAGGLMCTELLRFDSEATIQDVLDDLAEHADRYRDFDVQYSFVTSQGQLVGVLPMRDLILARRYEPLTKIMIANPVSVRDDADLDEIEELFDSHRFLGLPVVNEERQLLGVILRSAVEHARASEDSRDYLKSRGIVGGEEIRSLPLAERSRRRLSWLSVNILLNIMAASIIALYQDTLASVIALAVFLPIISDMSGCSGNQAVAVSMRELSLGLARVDDVFRVWMKELAVGIVNGIALGVLIGVAAMIWQRDLMLALVVGGALCLNTLVAVSIGGVVPLVVKRFGFDPAIASGPILTTVTDMVGFLLVLWMASVLLV